MPVICITYDMGEGGSQDYDGLVACIQSLGPACDVTETTWLVSTPLTSRQVLAQLSEFTGDYDRVIVFAVSGGADWSVGATEFADRHADAPDAAAWMLEHLGPGSAAPPAAPGTPLESDEAGK